MRSAGRELSFEEFHRLRSKLNWHPELIEGTDIDISCVRQLARPGLPVRAAVMAPQEWHRADGRVLQYEVVARRAVGGCSPTWTPAPEPDDINRGHICIRCDVSAGVLVNAIHSRDAYHGFECIGIRCLTRPEFLWLAFCLLGGRKAGSGSGRRAAKFLGERLCETASRGSVTIQLGIVYDDLKANSPSARQCDAQEVAEGGLHSASLASMAVVKACADCR